MTNNDTHLNYPSPPLVGHEEVGTAFGHHGVICRPVLNTGVGSQNSIPGPTCVVKNSSTVRGSKW